MTSSMSVYDDGAELSESAFDPLNYEFTTTEKKDYKEAKRQAEVVFAKSKGFATSLVRFPIILGEDDYTGRLKFHVDRIANNQPIYFPNINAKISVIDSASAARALLDLAKTSGVGPINLAAKTPMPLRDMVNQIADVTNQKPVLTSDNTEQNHSPYGVDQDWYLNVEKADKLGIQSSDLNEWLPQLIKTIAR